MYLFRKLMSDDRIEKKYVNRGISFGEAVSFLAYGECVGFENRLNKLSKWEKEYVRRGFKTISIDDFVKASRGENIDTLLRKPLDEEELIFYAEEYRQKYLGKVSPLIDLSRVMSGEIQMTSVHGNNITTQFYKITDEDLEKARADTTFSEKLQKAKLKTLADRINNRKDNN